MLMIRWNRCTLVHSQAQVKKTQARLDLVRSGSRIPEKLSLLSWDFQPSFRPVLAESKKTGKEENESE